MKRLFLIVVMLMWLGVSTMAQANVITSMVGDKDCFGLPGVSSCTEGDLWNTGLGGALYRSYRGVDDPEFTDRWYAGKNITYTHGYSLTGIPTSAYLQILTAGIADNELGTQRGPWDVYFNNTIIGQFAFNDTPNSYQEVRTFRFTVPIDLLTGTDTIILGINPTARVDAFSIDYSELTIVTPEPATMLLLGLGLVGVVGMRKKFRS